MQDHSGTHPKIKRSMQPSRACTDGRMWANMVSHDRKSRGAGRNTHDNACNRSSNRDGLCSHHQCHKQASSSADRVDSTCVFDAKLTARTDRGGMSVQNGREKEFIATPHIHEDARQGHPPLRGVADAMSPRWDALQVYLSHSRP